MSIATVTGSEDSAAERVEVKLDVSMEGRVPDGENITEIQNYLATFNKEIADGSSGAAADQTILPVPEVEEGEEGTYYVTQSADGTTIQTYQYTEDGQVVGAETTEALLHAVGSQQQGEAEGSANQPAYVAMQPSHENMDAGQEQQVVAVTQAGGHSLATMITQVDDSGEEVSGAEGATMVASTGQTIRMVVRQPDGTETEQTIPVTGAGAPTLVTSDGQEIHVSDEGTLQMISNFAEQAGGSDSDGNNQVILNSGSSYQTVTIVPSDTNPGEVSYVLIVSQPDDKDKGGDLDMSVYDFNEGEKHLHHGEDGMLIQEAHPEQTTKIRTIKVQKKSQTVTQAHMCNYCNYTSPKRYLLSRHMKSHSEERPHKCSVCERGFKTLASLQNHVNTHTGTRPHQCKECEAAFTTSGELVRHVRYKHTHEKPHRCTECDYASVELSKLKRHMRCHTGERPYQCPHCTYASPDTYKLKRHLRIHTGEKPYECDVCHARFTQSNSLKAHKLIHSGNKPVFQCELCPTTCGRKTDLRIHVQKLHTSDKPLKCKRCGKSFPDRYTYKVHVKTHEGEKCFKCDLCAYASISQRHLESHMLIHTDQKPYRCEECGQSFRQKQLLKRHRNLYHDPNYIPPTPKEKTHECPECNKTFRHKGNLIRHLAVHDPEASEAAKEEAMRIGQPKGPGEEHDGEEDDEDYMDEDDMMDDDDGMHGDAGEGQQVVVFEVIQLPASEGTADHQLAQNAAAAMAMAANGTATTADGMTIIQQVEGIPDDMSAAVLNPSQGMGLSHHYSNYSMSIPVTTPRRRGRPRKYPLPSDLVNISQPNRIVLQQHQVSRQLRKRKPMEMDPDEDQLDEDEDDEDEDVVVTPSPRRGRPPGSGRPRGRPPKIYSQSFVNSAGMIMESVEEVEEMDDRLTVAEAVSAVTPVVMDPEELARHEQETARRRLEQKQKDMAECFGFNDDDEDDDDGMLDLPSGPTVTIVNGDTSDGHHYS